jgi:hypothetical protein
MAQNHLANLKKVVPSDTKATAEEFSYIQCGVSGDIAVKMKSGAVVVISAALLDKMSMVPVGTMDHVMVTGTTATDIYAW